MGFGAELENLSLWVLALLLFAGMLVARELGKFLRDRRKLPDADTENDSDAFAMTSVLGLLALLIGFTFSIALSRYESRRELVVKEANAIGTTWLRMQLLDAPERARMEDLLRRYVNTRVAFGEASSPAEEIEQYRRSEAMQNDLWAGLIAAIAPFRDTPRASLLVTTTNESIDLAAERFATRQAHIPPRILRMLVLFALLAAGMVGYERGHQRRATTLLFILLTLAATLVVDLDRPSTGMVNVPQDPMLELRASMQPQAH
ncbi:hypothetical protein [Lysobacter auxotrophicus]|uniref:DUF4239 domain-containing protein n=1 Tax=Lysobacter auxotrophicus TaxID=2992573 RepID=A0ABM8DDF0_9GAMM|nr:hypothetical protein [Lysobacter auxotrophicus]BDU16633.1 DUF4239 domain-containing protein [Lysobacter auxotrophicus]